MIVRNNSTTRGWQVGSTFLEPGSTKACEDRFYDDISSNSDLTVTSGAPADLGKHHDAGPVMYDIDPVTGGISIYGLVVVPGLVADDESAAADNAVKIQKAISTGGKVLVAMPGVIYVSATLLVPSNTSVTLGANTRLKLAGGLTNTPLIRNADTSGGNVNIEISGGIWDGNNANQTRNDSPNFSAFFIFMQNVTGLSVHDLTVVNPIAWGMAIATCSNFSIKNIAFAYTNMLANMDGVHMAGACTDGVVDGIYGNTNDDMVAIVTQDYGVYAAATTPGGASNIVIKNVISDATAGTYRHVRLMDNSTYPAKNVSVSTIKGKYRTGGILLYGTSSFEGGMFGISIDDIDLEPFGDTSGVPTIDLSCRINDLRISNVRRRVRSTETPKPLIGVNTSTIVIKNLTIDGLDIYDLSTAGANWIELNHTAPSIYHFNLSNVKAWRSGTAAGNLINVGAAVVSRGMLSNVRTEKISRQVYLDVAAGGFNRALLLNNCTSENNSNALIATAAAALLPYIALNNVQTYGTMGGANGVIRFSGLSGVSLIDISNCDLQNSAAAILARSASESIRVRSLCSPVNSALLTPARGDVILDSAASGDPKRYDGAAWVTL